MDYKKIKFREVIKYYLDTFKQDKDIIIVVFLVLQGICNGLVPILAVVFPKFIIDAISLGDIEKVVTYVLLFGLSSLVLVSASTYMRGIISGRILASRVKKATEVGRDFRYVKFSYLEDESFQRKRSEAQRTFRNGNEGYQGFILIIMNQLPMVISLIGYVLILGLFNPWIIVVAVGSAILQLLLALKAKKYKIDHYESLTDEERKAQYFYRTSQDYTFAKDIRTNHMSKPLYKKYNNRISSAMSIIKKTFNMERNMSFFDVLFILITNGLTYYLVVTAYFEGSISLGTITMTIMTTLAITVQMQASFKAIANVKEETDKTKKYIAFMRGDLAFDKEETFGEKPAFDIFKIEFKNVSFKYPNSDKYVLNNVSFTIEKHEKLALVGINGAGKTTIVKLVTGLYLPTKGDILINGYNTKDLNLFHLRSQIAVVFQDVHLYAATLVENITGLNPTDEERAHALKQYEKVGLLDKINSFEKKEDQILLKSLDDEGIELSGGEAQKLSIARALYKANTKLIILDEPTASLDAIAEKAVYENFNELIDNRTSIMISHRLASTRFCDHIVYLENGMIEEEGTHESLMKLENGKYREMFTVQGKYYKEGSDSNEETFNVYQVA